MSAPLNVGQILDTTDNAIKNIYKKMAKIDPKLKQYYNFRTTEDLIEKDSSMSGLKEAEFLTENATMMEDAPIQGFDQTYTQEVISICPTFTFLAWKFGIVKRKLENIAEDIQKSLNQKKEKLAAERLTNGYGTSYVHLGSGGSRSISLTGGDGIEPWSSAHTREDGGTNMNNVVYDGTIYSPAFDYSGYKAAIRTASLMVDPRGTPDVPTLDTLICKTGSSVHFKALEIRKAIESGKIPESSDNDGSGVPTFKIIDTPFLANDAYWGMFDSSRALTDKYGFQHVESLPNSLQKVFIVPKTNELQFPAFSLFRQGFNDVARCWVWSAGDKTTV